MFVKSHLNVTLGWIQVQLVVWGTLILIYKGTFQPLSKIFILYVLVGLIFHFITWSIVFFPHNLVVPMGVVHVGYV